MSEQEKVPATIGKRKFISYLTLIICATAHNVIALIMSGGKIVIFNSTFFITTFSIYLGVKELVSAYKKKKEVEKANGGN